jgi:hypothetical protein
VWKVWKVLADGFVGGQVQDLDVVQPLDTVAKTDQHFGERSWNFGEVDHFSPCTLVRSLDMHMVLLLKMNIHYRALL